MSKKITIVLLILIILSFVFISNSKIILLIAVGPGIPSIILTSLKNRKKFYEPNGEKAILLVFFLLLFPSPLILIGVIGLVPAIYSLLILMSAVSDVGGWSILMLSEAVVYYSVIVFLNYMFICFLYKESTTKNLLWIIAGILILLSFLNIYIVADAGGGRHTYNSVALVKELFVESFK